MKAPLVYIAGPFRGQKEEAPQRFRDASSRLWDKGYITHDPIANTLHLDGEFTDQEFIDRDLSVVEKCDMVYMLAGFEQSSGASQEQSYAEVCGIPIYYEGWKEPPAAEDFVDGFMGHPVVKAEHGTVKLDKSGGYPDNNPKTAFGMKKLPLHLAPPSAVAALAEAFTDGASKYGPYNWREKKISSSVYYAACLRHIMAWWDGEEDAEDSGWHHLHHAMACIAMIVDGKSVDKLNDDRPIKGAMKDFIKDYKVKE